MDIYDILDLVDIHEGGDSEEASKKKDLLTCLIDNNAHHILDLVKQHDHVVQSLCLNYATTREDVFRMILEILNYPEVMEI